MTLLYIPARQIYRHGKAQALLLVTSKREKQYCNSQRLTKGRRTKADRRLNGLKRLSAPFYTRPGRLVAWGPRPCLSPSTPPPPPQEISICPSTRLQKFPTDVTDSFALGAMCVPRPLTFSCSIEWLKALTTLISYELFPFSSCHWSCPSPMVLYGNNNDSWLAIQSGLKFTPSLQIPISQSSRKIFHG